MDSALTCLLNQGSAWVAAGVRGRRRGNRHPSIVPYETYETADRPLAVAVGQRPHVRAVVRRGRPGGRDERFATNTARVAHADELAAALEAVLRTEPAAVMARAAARGEGPAGPINEIDEAFALAEELGMEPSEVVDGVPLIRPPLRIDGERPPIRHRPPRLDEHAEALRTWLATER